MKISDVKHNHSLTDLLKILLFAILMLAPIASVATRCLYVVANKNAYQSYYGETINEVSYQDVDTYSTPNRYRFVNDSTLDNVDTNGSKYFTFDKILDYKTNNNSIIPELDWEDYNYCIMYLNSGYRTLGLVTNDSSTTRYIQTRYIDYIDFENFSTADSIFMSYLKIPHYNNYSYLDNVFEYSVSQLENDQLFSWTSNTPVYTGINAMCTQLGITGQAIPIILSYWLILTCIYVVIDIVIKLFTLLTHLIGRKAG